MSAELMGVYAPVSAAAGGIAAGGIAAWDLLPGAARQDEIAAI